MSGDYFGWLLTEGSAAIFANADDGGDWIDGVNLQNVWHEQVGPDLTISWATATTISTPPRVYERIIVTKMSSAQYDWQALRENPGDVNPIATGESQDLHDAIRDAALSLGHRL